MGHVLVESRISMSSLLWWLSPITLSRMLSKIFFIPIAELLSVASFFSSSRPWVSSLSSLSSLTSGSEMLTLLLLSISLWIEKSFSLSAFYSAAWREIIQGLHRIAWHGWNEKLESNFYDEICRRIETSAYLDDYPLSDIFSSILVNTKSRPLRNLTGSLIHFSIICNTATSKSMPDLFEWNPSEKQAEFMTSKPLELIVNLIDSSTL